MGKSPFKMGDIVELELYQITLLFDTILVLFIILYVIGYLIFNLKSIKYTILSHLNFARMFNQYVLA